MERLTNSTLVRRSVPWRQLLLVGFATLLLASMSKKICPPEVQDFVHFTRTQWMDIWMLAIWNLSPATHPFNACGPRQCKTTVLGSFPN